MTSFFLEVTEKDIALAGLCAACFVLGGCSSLAGLALYLWRCAGFGLADAWAWMRGG